MIMMAQRSVSTSPRLVREKKNIINPKWMSQILMLNCFVCLFCFDYVKFSCSTWQLAPGRSSADCRSALCSDQHVKLHTTGIYPASPRISGNTTDLHRKDDWWYDEVIYIWLLIFLHLNIQNQKYVNVFFCLFFRFMFILMIIGTAFLCGINNIYVPYVISPNLGR